MVSHKYIRKRLFQVILTVYSVLTLTFLLTRLVPGGPEDVIRGQLMKQYGNTMSQQEINRRIELYVNYKTNAPIWEQYLNYLWDIVHLDFGRSIKYGTAVIDIIIQALPWTLFIMGTALVIQFVLNVVLGAIMAYKEGSRFDTSMTGISLFITSIPFYVVAILAVYILGFVYGIFPTSGHYSPTVQPGFTVEFVASALNHAILPILSMVITGIGAGALTMRGNAISVLGEDFLRVGRLRGLSDSRLIGWHVLPNAILPMYTGLMISIGFMFGGAVILEEIFAYPGVGYYMIRAINARDYPLMMGIFILITTAVAVSLLIADLTYSMIDPRINEGDENAESYGGGIEGFLRTLVHLARRGWRTLMGSHESNRHVDRPAESGSANPLEAVSDESDLTKRELLNVYFDLWIKTPAQIIWSDLRARVGLAILGLFVLVGVLGPAFVEPTSMGDGPKLVPPFTNWEYPLGTTMFGHDLFAQAVLATPQMLKMIFAGSVFATSVGTIVGTVAGYVGGRIDRVLTTISDIAMTIPGLPLVIVLASLINPENPYLVGMLLTVNAWAGLARTIRTQVLSYREESYVEASRIMGVPTHQIISKDIIPNIMPYVLVNFMQSARNVIFGSVGLYFIGVLPFASTNWGVMMNQAYDRGGALYTLEAVHWFLIPMAAVVGLSFGLILLAQGMDRLFNPRIRARHADTLADEEKSGEVDVGGGGGGPAIHQSD